MRISDWSSDVCSSDLAERTQFYNRGVVQAVRVLGQQGQWQDQSKFVRAIANNAVTPADHLLADELSKVIGRPDLGVMAGRKANASGQLGYSMASRSEEHTSELQSLMRNSYAVLCLKKKKHTIS